MEISAFPSSGDAISPCSLAARKRVSNRDAFVNDFISDDGFANEKKQRAGAVVPGFSFGFGWLL
jgi:hypothetical protein